MLDVTIGFRYWWVSAYKESVWKTWRIFQNL